ncbi:acyl-CoA dehydrogenase family protein [Streptomyces physcomitrii]|uniref:acyl-CoA dehydrogenase family protein n=1 Tax=Streptomyces physcomitrii TaxID=2724184 RepID=UPI0033DD769A
MTARAHAADVMNRAVAPGHRTLDAEVEQVRREARRRFASFVLDRANPGAHFRNQASRPLDNSVFEKAGDLGLMRFSLPASIGGEGRDKLAWGVVVEEIARLSRDPGFAVLLDISVEICELILSSGRPELIERYVPDLVAGRRFGVQGAYESLDPYDYRSTARLEDGAWVLNGAKRFLAGARFADLFLLFVRDEASNDMLAFLVEKDDPGVTPIHMDTMGMHTMGLGQVVLDRVRLPEWRLVWRADALSELNTYARIRRTMSACGVLGALDGVIENCVEALATRRRAGRRVLDYANVERTVGEMRALLMQARASVYRALDGTRDTGRDPHFDEFATVAKHHASECALRIGQLVMGLMGGEAYMSAFPWERFMRDILGLISGQGSQETLLMQLGQRTIVGIEGTRVREEAAERTVAKLADSWWALHAAEAAANGAPAQLADAVAEMTTAAKLDPVPAEQRAELTAFLDTSHAALAAARSGQPPGALPEVPGGFTGRLAERAAGARSFLACALAQETGLLARLLEPCTPKEAAAGVGGPDEDTTARLLDTLVSASLVRRDAEGRLAAEEGLERVLVGGPRTTAFAARLRRTVTAAGRLRTGEQAAGRAEFTGCGAESAPLADALVNELLGRLEGLPERLDRPGAKVGCAAGDGGAAAAELARHIPFVPVLALEPEAAADTARAARDPRTPAGESLVEVRTGGPDSFTAEDRLALAWLPTAGRTAQETGRAAGSAAGALLPGGWLLLVAPLPPKRPAGAAALRLELALTGAPAPAEGALEEALTEAGLTHLRTAWEDPALGIRLLAARRP